MMTPKSESVSEIELLRAALSFQVYYEPDPQVSPGKGPQRCPVSLPSFERLIGTVEFGGDEQYIAQIYFQALPLAGVAAFMTAVNEKLIELGWRPRADLSLTSIFSSTGLDAEQSLIGEATLFVYLYERSEVTASWHLRPAGETLLALKLELQVGKA